MTEVTTPPTHVFGVAAREIAQANGWKDAVIMEGSTLNAQKGADGSTPEKRRRLCITEGSYSGIDYYLGGNRPFMDVFGFGETRPTLQGDTVSIGKSAEYTFRGINLHDCGFAITSYHDTIPVNALIEDVDQYGASAGKSYNGFVNPNTRTKRPQLTVFRRVTSDAMGDEGNTKHSIYWEGRPDSTLVLDEFVGNGARACSIVKSTCGDVQVRDSVLSTVSVRNPQVTAGSLLDVAAFCRLTVSGTTFNMWRGDPKSKLGAGLRVPAIHRRCRQPSIGSDTPAYPDLSWDPPRSSQTTSADPGGGWGRGPDTYVSEGFWQWLREQWDAGIPVEGMFPAYISRCMFRNLSEKQIPWLRDDGTRAIQPADQFGPGYGRRMPAGWVERSITAYALCTFEGNIGLPVLDDEQHITAYEDGFLVNRTLPWHFPRAVEVPLELPAWFLR